jgi:hypothetical protein
LNIQDALAKHQDRLMTLPNVTGAGIGEREGKDVIVVFVTRRVDASSLRPEEVVPKTLEGFTTDVREIGEVTAPPS